MSSLFERVADRIAQENDRQTNHDADGPSPTTPPVGTGDDTTAAGPDRSTAVQAEGTDKTG